MVNEDDLQIVRLFLDIGADPKEQQQACVAWEITLQRLENLAKRDDIVHSRRDEMLKCIEQYRSIFLAYGVELTPTKPSVDLNAHEDAWGTMHSPA